MIVGTPGLLYPAGKNRLAEGGIAPARTLAWRRIAVFCGLFAIVVFLQYLSGAFRTEFADYPDEPAHYVTSRMVHDFLLSGDYRHPMDFAQDYYNHYPKVAFGHWPPLLYVVQALWMMLFSSSRVSVLLELALTTTVVAFATYTLAVKRFGEAGGLLAAAGLVSLPVIQMYTNQEMAESLLLLTSFCAAIWFARFLESGRWQDSLWFAIFTSCAVLTKGNGWALAMVPPFAVLFTRRFAVLKSWAFWLPVPVVGVLCLPWQLITFEIAERGWPAGDHPSVQHAMNAFVQYLGLMKEMAGWGVACFAVLGIIVMVGARFLKKQVEPLDAVMLALILSAWFFHCIVPVGVEIRKIIVVAPAIILFAGAGLQWLGKRIGEGGWVPARWAQPALAAALVLLFAGETFAIPRKIDYGFTATSSFLEQRPELRNKVILVCSQLDGEGLLISEMVMKEPALLHHSVLRATKLLSRSDWNGTVSELFYNTPEQVNDVLKRENVRAVVLDSYPARTQYIHYQLLRRAIESRPAIWTLVGTFGGGKIQVYEQPPA